jgi:hypothetical protein
LSASPLDRATKVVIEGVERVGLQFRECAPQLPFNAVDGVKEGATVDLELAAAEFPVGAQEVVISEYFMVEIIEHAPANEAEVGHIFFALAGVGTAALTAAADFQGNRAGMSPVGAAFPKAV